MTNREQAKMTMYNGIDAFFTANAGVYSAKPAFVTAVTNFRTARTAAINAAAKTGTDNTGFSDNKKIAKKAMADKVAVLAGLAHVHFDDIGRFDLSGQLHVAVTDYFFSSDSDAAAMTQSAKDLMNANIGLLTPDYVVAADMTALQALIDTFIITQGSSDSAHTVEPVDTANFKAALKAADLRIEKLKLLGRMFQVASPDFYNGLLEVTTLPAVNVHHTTASGIIRNAVTNAVIVGASVHSDKSAKTAVTDLNGFYQLDHLRAGEDIFHITGASSVAKDVQVHVQRGRDNGLDFNLNSI